MGTGGPKGYIDDELPDYVMIMVANKRSKSQMIEDLKLFLESNAEDFVVWLYQVLERLQQVTLPVANINKNKRKTGTSTTVPTKKEKKDRKKDKKKSKYSTTTPDIEKRTAPIASITDVLAEQMIKKAKESLENTEKVTKEEVKGENKASTSGNEFDIPTIAEMSETSKSTREKDLQELEELQKKINRAKRQLRAIDSDKESEDEDFLNLKDDDSQVGFEEEESTVLEKEKENVRRRSPIIFDKKSESDKDASTSKTKSNAQVENKKTQLKPSVQERVKAPEIRDEKRVEKRINKISLSAVRRAEKEIYVTGSYKKLEEERKSKKLSVVDDKNREKDRSHEKVDSSKPTKLKRRKIESRVYVARNVQPEADDEEEVDVPVNSVVKIKPRTTIPVHKQACKNLLLRAVAEAQKSTALASSRTKSCASSLVSKPPSKKYEQTKTIKSNIIIQIPSDISNSLNTSESDEYIPEPTNSSTHDTKDMVYIPRSINLRHRIDIRDQISDKDSRTQFVVTLDGRYENNKRSTTPPLAKRRSSSQDKIVKSTKSTIITKVVNDLSTKNIKRETETPELEIESRSRKKLKVIEKEKSTKSPTPIRQSRSTREKSSSLGRPASPKAKSSSKRSYDATKPTVSRLIIKTTDTTDDEKDLDKSFSPPKEKRQMRSKFSPIKFDLDREIEIHHRSSDALNKYDNIPPRKLLLFYYIINKLILFSFEYNFAYFEYFQF